MTRRYLTSFISTTYSLNHFHSLDQSPEVGFFLVALVGDIRIKVNSRVAVANINRRDRVTYNNFQQSPTISNFIPGTLLAVGYRYDFLSEMAWYSHTTSPYTLGMASELQDSAMLEVLLQAIWLGKFYVT